MIVSENSTTLSAENSARIEARRAVPMCSIAGHAAKRCGIVIGVTVGIVAWAGLLSVSASAQTPPIPATSANWSGIVLEAPVPLAQGNFHFVQVSADWTVPGATYRPGNCDAFESAAQWVGLDGAGGNDVLQAGVTTSVNCSTGAVEVSPWFGWYPAGFQNAGGLHVSPGDTVTAWVWVDAAGMGHGYVGDLTTGENSGTMSVPMPTGSVTRPEVGYSAEWVIEDNSDSAGLSGGYPIANYGSDTMTNCWAADAVGNGYGPGALAAIPGVAEAPVEYAFTLSDGSSVPTIIGAQAILFQVAP